MRCAGNPVKTFASLAEFASRSAIEPRLPSRPAPARRVGRIVVLFLALALASAQQSSAFFFIIRAAAPASAMCLPNLPSNDVLDPSSTPNAQNESIPFDLTFLNAMVQHSTGTLALANLALQQTGDSRVWRIALRMAESRATEIHLLRNWQHAWYPDAVSPQPSSVSRADTATPVPCSSDDFDREFLQQTIVLQQAVIELATAALTRAEHPDLRAYAESTLTARSQEIAAMQNLLDALPPP